MEHNATFRGGARNSKWGLPTGEGGFEVLHFLTKH